MDLGGGSTTFLGIIVEKLLLKIVIPTFFKRGPISRKFPISRETVNTFINLSDISPPFGLFLEYISKRRGVLIPEGNTFPSITLSIIYIINVHAGDLLKIDRLFYFSNTKELSIMLFFISSIVLGIIASAVYAYIKSSI